MASVRRPARSAPAIEESAVSERPAPSPDSEPNLEALEWEWQQASAAREAAGVQARAEGEEFSSLIEGPTHDGSEDQIRSAHSASLFNEEDFASPRRRRIGLRAILIAALTVTTAVVGSQYWVPSRSTPPPAVPINRAEPVLPQLPVPTAPVEPVPTSGTSTPGRSTPAMADRPQQAGFAIQVGTFQVANNATQAVKQLQNAGYPTYSTPVTLGSGRASVGVFIGPYGERAEAESELQRVKGANEYASARVVRVVPAESGKPKS